MPIATMIHFETQISEMGSIDLEVSGIYVDVRSLDRLFVCHDYQPESIPLH